MKYMKSKPYQLNMVERLEKNHRIWTGKRKENLSNLKKKT